MAPNSMFHRWADKFSGDPKKLWVRYSVGLSLIVGLLLGAHFIHVHSIKQGAQDAALIDLSGRQRMLSQRMAGLVSFLRDDVERPRFEGAVAGALSTFEQSHYHLLEASNDFPRAHETYAQGQPNGLDAKSLAFIELIQSALEMPVDDPALEETINEIEAVAFEPLLRSLDDAVKALAMKPKHVWKSYRLYRTRHFCLLSSYWPWRSCSSSCPGKCW